MAKRWSKQKAGQQKSKKRKKVPIGTGSAESASGTMGGFRKGLKAIAGTGSNKKGDKSTLDRVINVLLWGAVVVAAIYAYQRCA